MVKVVSEIVSPYTKVNLIKQESWLEATESHSNYLKAERKKIIIYLLI